MKCSACTILALLAAPVHCSPYGLDWKPHSEGDLESLVNTLANKVTDWKPHSDSEVEVFVSTLANQVPDSTSATEEKPMARKVLSKHKAVLSTLTKKVTDWKSHSDIDVESLVSTLANQVADSTSATEERHMARAVLSKHRAPQRKPVEKLQEPFPGWLSGGLGKFLGVEPSPTGKGEEFSTRWKTSGKATAAKMDGVPAEKNAYVRTLVSGIPTEAEDPQVQRWNRERARDAQDDEDGVAKVATPAPVADVVGPGRAMKVALKISQAMDDDANGIPKINWSMKPKPAVLASTNGGEKSNTYLESVDLPQRPEAVNSATDPSYTNLYVNNRYMADLDGPALMEPKPWERHLKTVEQAARGEY